MDFSIIIKAEVSSHWTGRSSDYNYPNVLPYPLSVCTMVLATHSGNCGHPTPSNVIVQMAYCFMLISFDSMQSFKEHVDVEHIYRILYIRLSCTYLPRTLVVPRPYSINSDSFLTPLSLTPLSLFWVLIRF